jgi:hypothetical protein
MGYGDLGGSGLPSEQTYILKKYGAKVSSIIQKPEAIGKTPEILFKFKKTIARKPLVKSGDGRIGPFNQISQGCLDQVGQTICSG